MALAQSRLSGQIAAIVTKHDSDSILRAVLGPTNTGKTHLAIERMCGYSSGTIGFPLRLLAREVYDKVCAIKGESQVALITGEEKIEPPTARYFLCTAEAMPRDGGKKAFVALDEAQLAADRERGHIFTDRLLHARGREETMLMGAETLAPLAKALLPDIQIDSRPRFSTLTHTGAAKLSRLPRRSAIVCFSIEQVYQMAELLRRFRGGAAVVMGALSPETRNKQVELFQSGEVDYIVSTDAIGMGLNLDIRHVAFAALSKFDGMRKRRLTPAEMAQIAGRAGRHQTDGSFGVLAGGDRTGGKRAQSGREDLAFTEEEIYAIENHKFAPVTKLFWRDPTPRFDTLSVLTGDLEAPPYEESLTPAPEAIDLAVLKRLTENGGIRDDVATPKMVRRFWHACQLPDFRQQGPEMHARFVARLWKDLRSGYLGPDYVAARINELDHVQGAIEILQGRLAAIRSWAYICQRPDWVHAREEMAARARSAEARLSDALHQRLTERFVNRRTALLMKIMGKDAGLMKVELAENGQVTVEGQTIGQLDGFRFVVDKDATSEDRKLMLAAAEKHLPALLAEKASALVTSELGALSIEKSRVMRGEQVIAQLEAGKTTSRPRLTLSKDLSALEPAQRSQLEQALGLWLESKLQALAPLRGIEDAAGETEAGSEVRALLLTLAARNGAVQREDAGLAVIPKEKRPFMRRLGVIIGALDVYMPALLKPAPRQILHAIGADKRPLNPGMEAVIAGGKQLPAGYRRAGEQAVRVDMAEKLIRAAHDSRVKKNAKHFPVDVALATSMGLLADNFQKLMRDAGFRPLAEITMAEGVFGPPPARPWSWRPTRKDQTGQSSNDRRNAGRKGSRDDARNNGRNSKSGSGPKSDTHSKRPPKPESNGNHAFAGLADLLK